MRSIWRWSIAVVAAQAMTGLADDFVLAERGRPCAVQIVNRSAGVPTADYAAEELQKYVSKMTGVTLPVVTNATETTGTVSLRCDGREDGDAFEITSDADGVRVVGGVRGVLYGAYELLETYGGVGWYASWHEVVPTRARFVVPRGLKIAEKPAFRLRDPYWDGVFVPEFAARLRVNGNSGPKRDEKFGGKPFRFSWRLGNCHTFDTLLPPKEYFDAHPEYFAEFAGARRKEKSQPCLTNPDVLRIVTSNVLAQIEREPDVRYYGVSQNDNMNYCRCARCAAVDAEEDSPAGTLVRFVNAVADAVAAKHPGKMVSTLAYQYTRKPPKKTRLRPNVLPVLCNIECDFAHPIDEKGIVRNESFCADTRGWQARADGLYVWDYAANFRDAMQEFPYFDVMRENYRFFRDSGASDIFEEGHTCPHTPFAELKTYLAAKWMWNPDLPLEPLLQRFFTGYYGKAAPFVRRYYDSLVARQRQASEKGKRPLDVYQEPLHAVTADDAFVEEAVALWKSAEEAVAAEPKVYGYNVRMGALAVDYLRFTRQAPVVWVTRHPELFNNGRDAAALAQRILARVGEGKVKLPAKVMKRLETTAALTEVKASDSVEIPAELIHNDWCRLADDPTAEGGKAILLPGYSFGVSASFPLIEVGYDADATYTLSVRIRAERKADAPDGYVFWGCVGGPGGQEPTVETKASDCGPGWTWVDVATWRPKRTDRLCLSAGRFDKEKDKANPALEKLYIDRVRLVRHH